MLYNPVSFFFLTCLPQKAFFQKKKGKKKAIKRYGQRGKPKGNGIIGGDPLGEETVYAVVFWWQGRLVSIIP